MTSPPPKVDGAKLLARFRGYLRDQNLPVTEQRDAIASAMFFSHGHLSVDDLDQRLRADGVHVGRATIYRTLELMDRAGLVDAGSGHHEHLICRDCGKVIEFTSDRIERMNMLIAEEYGFRLHHHRLEIYGVCGDCQEHDATTVGESARREGRET